MIKIIKTFLGWLTCPRCGELVKPAFANQTGRWRCPNCQHDNW